MSSTLGGIKSQGMPAPEFRAALNAPHDTEFSKRRPAEPKQRGMRACIKCGRIGNSRRN